MGDGNCLFRCFSYYIFQDENKHSDIRSQLTGFIEKNPTIFKNDCLPLSVKEHVKQMSKDQSWGTNAEIKAAAYLFKIPVFVATKKTSPYYYWTQFQGSDPLLTLPEASEQIEVPKNISHIEVIHLTDPEHYNVVVTSNDTLSESKPFEGDKSSNRNDYHFDSVTE